MILVDGEEVGVRLPLLDYTEKKIVAIKEWDDAVGKEIKRVKGLTGEKGKWIVSSREEGAVYGDDQISILSGIGPITSKKLQEAGIATISNLLHHQVTLPSSYTSSQWAQLLLKIPPTLAGDIAPIPIDHRQADNPCLSLYGSLWEEEIAKVSA